MNDSAFMLETMIDHHGLSTVLTMIADVCGEKAEHLRAAWQDGGAARLWEKAARRVNGAAGAAQLIFGE